VTRRNSRPCRTCSRSTKSTTRYCPDCRPEDATPHVTRVEGGITFAGLTLTDRQAIRLANQIADSLETAP
jgi:hypothetical protein